MKTENHRVLIIDDERPVLMTLEALLKRHGYQVDTAPTAAQGLKVLKSKSPTLVLLDLRLPDADAGNRGVDRREGAIPCQRSDRGRKRGGQGSARQRDPRAEPARATANGEAPLCGVPPTND